MTQYVKLTVNNSALNNNLNEIATTNLIDNSNASIFTETSRAISKSTFLSNTISTETSRATISEVILSSSISTETSRATKSEGTLSSNISIETSRAVSVENSISTYLSTFISGANPSMNTVFEISKVLLDDDRTVSNVASIIGVEGSRAVSQETLLSQNLYVHNTNTLNSNNTVSSAISNETFRAVSVEDSLSNRISNQISNSVSSETVLSNNISTTISNSKSTEIVLSNNISSEYIRANASETSIVTNYTNTNNKLQYITTENNNNTILNAKINLNYGSPSITDSNKIGYRIKGDFSVTRANFGQVQLFSLNSINGTDSFKVGKGVWFISCTVTFRNVNGASSSHERCIVVSLTQADKLARYRVEANNTNRGNKLEEFNQYLPAAPGLRYSDREYDPVSDSGYRQQRTVSGCYVNSNEADRALYINIGHSVDSANQTFQYDCSISATRIA